MTTVNFCFYLQNRLIQTSQTGGQWYSDTSPFSITCTDWPDLLRPFRPAEVRCRGCSSNGWRNQDLSRGRICSGTKSHKTFFLLSLLESIYASGLGRLLALPSNTRPDWKGHRGTNTLAYFSRSSVPTKKRFTDVVTSSSPMEKDGKQLQLLWILSITALDN